MSRSGRIVLVTALVITAGAVTWRKVIRDQVIPENFGVVEDGAIYRSALLSERMLAKVCDDHGIRTIVDLTGNSTDYERAVAEERSINLIEIPLIGDGTGDPVDMARALDAVADESLHPLLVHCHAGAQRTGSIVMLYRHLEQGMTIPEAYPETFEYGHEEDEWILLAHLVEHLDEIRAARAGTAIAESAQEPVEESVAEADDPETP